MYCDHIVTCHHCDMSNHVISCDRMMYFCDYSMSFFNHIISYCDHVMSYCDHVMSSCDHVMYYCDYAMSCCEDQCDRRNVLLWSRDTLWSQGQLCMPGRFRGFDKLRFDLRWFTKQFKDMWRAVSLLDIQEMTDLSRQRKKAVARLEVRHVWYDCRSLSAVKYFPWQSVCCCIAWIILMP